MAEKNKKVKKEKKEKAVFSVRVSEEIIETFKEECDRYDIPTAFVISEYMKKFIVLNINRESYESPIFEEEKVIKKEISENDLGNILEETE